MARTRPWEVSDELWEHAKPLISSAPSYVKGGRPRMDDRKAEDRHDLRAAYRDPIECLTTRVGSQFDRARSVSRVGTSRIVPNLLKHLLPQGRW